MIIYRKRLKRRAAKARSSRKGRTFVASIKKEKPILFISQQKKARVVGKEPDHIEPFSNTFEYTIDLEYFSFPYDEWLFNAGYATARFPRANSDFGRRR